MEDIAAGNAAAEVTFPNVTRQVAGHSARDSIKE
jgi:hypothetical protein